ncbi:TetR/AcrR family transcriptional regulator [Streptomyces sp. HK10]|uniref:TetR/AcrR family transcriptional regulator n=1 Tax=Streptomyces sp. HK10 TaxID=3373255 RepID=UPI0037485E8F
MTGTEKPKPPSRKERRRDTESVILTAARELFARQGFQSTTIRAVARAAGVDPSLVMQYFGNKEGLFAAAARSTVDNDALLRATRAQLPRRALEHLFADFEDPDRRESAAALLRSCLTHPGAQEVVRDLVMGESQTIVASAIGGDDAQLRAGVLNACTLGLTIARYLLRMPAVAQADREELERIMLPALRTIVDPSSGS